MWVTMVTKGAESKLLQAMGHLSSPLLLPRLLGVAAGRQATVPGRPPRQGWTSPRWAPRPQCCRGPGQGPVETRRQAGATRPGTQSLARPAAPRSRSTASQLCDLQGQEGGQGRAGELTTLLQPSLSPALFSSHPQFASP